MNAAIFMTLMKNFPASHLSREFLQSENMERSFRMMNTLMHKCLIFPVIQLRAYANFHYTSSINNSEILPLFSNLFLKITKWPFESLN